jgi:integrase
MASYALKRFRDTFLPQAVELRPRQPFYSLRHSFRDALRRAEASADILKALGGWTQGAAVSDAYGEGLSPDDLKDAVARLSYPGLDLSHLYVHVNAATALAAEPHAPRP